MPATSERTLRLLALLQARPVWSGEELARRLEVTARTLRTDVNRLRELGYQVQGVPGTGGGYRLGPGESLPPLLFDADESVAVLIGLRQLAGTGMEEAAEQAIAKVVRLLPARLRARAQAVVEFTESGGTPDVVVDPDLVAALTAACRQRTRVRIEYRSSTDQSTSREVEPYRVVGVRRRWYLLAWDTTRQDWRTLRLDRMQLRDTIAAPLFKPRPLPAADIAAYVLDRINRLPWPYQAEVIVQEAAHRLVDRLPPNAVIEPTGPHSSRVLMSADSPHHLAPWLGMLDADFRLADPDRDAELATEIQRVQRRYAAATTARTPASITAKPSPEVQ